MAKKLVNVYHDPITEKEFEGKAELLKRLGNLGDGLEIWRVKFEEDGFVAIRKIKKE